MPFTEQTQQQRGQDTNLGKSNRQGQQRTQGSSNRTNVEGARTTESTAQSRSIEAAVEAVTTTKAHADIQLTFRITLKGFDPTRRYAV
jgi:hypothetical protein